MLGYTLAALTEWSWEAALTRLLVTFVIAGAVGWALFTALPRLLPRRCRQCRTALVRTVERVYEGEQRPEIILPPIDLVRWTCPACGYEVCKVEADRGPTLFETGEKSRWPGGLGGDPPQTIKASIGAVMEWDRLLQRLKDQHEKVS